MFEEEMPPVQIRGNQVGNILDMLEVPEGVEGLPCCRMVKSYLAQHY